MEEYLDQYQDIIKISASKEKPDLKLLRNFLNEQEYGYIGNFLKAIGFTPKPKKAKLKETDVSNKPKSDQSSTKIDIDNLCINKEAKQIYKLMEYGKKYTVDSFDELSLKTSVILSSFSMLEVMGAIKKLPGGFYQKN